MAAYITVLNYVYSLRVFYYNVLSCVADVADCPLQRSSAIVIKKIIISIISRNFVQRIFSLVSCTLFSSKRLMQPVQTGLNQVRVSDHLAQVVTACLSARSSPVTCDSHWRYWQNSKPKWAASPRYFSLSASSVELTDRTRSATHHHGLTTHSIHQWPPASPFPHRPN